MSKAVFCMANDRSHAEAIVLELKAAGFASRDISVLLPDRSESRDFAHEKHTKAPEGATAGGGVGGILGGALGWLAGVGALAIPGLGPFIAAGPIMGMLGGAGLGAAVGGITGTLVGLGIPEYEARLYEGKLREGRILISVHAEDHEASDLAKDVFERANAQNISTGSEKAVDRERNERSRERR